MAFLDPVVTPDTAAFWEGANQGRLLFQRCRDCSFAWLPPGPRCPQCFSDSNLWEASAGYGRLVSWVIFRRSYIPEFQNDLPYACGLVELDEGPRVTVRLVDCDLESICVAMRMIVDFRKLAGTRLIPVFKPLQ